MFDLDAKNLVVLDCEVYPNYFLTALKKLDTEKVVKIDCVGENSTLSKENKIILKKILLNRETFGFNSINYDIPIILYALKGADCKEIYELSEKIINTQNRPWNVLREYDLDFIPEAIKHFDIKEPSPGVMVSLKLYGGRLHTETLQDLPIEPGKILEESEIEIIRDYCENDLNVTIELFEKIKEQLELRKVMSNKYSINLMSKSDAQIAEQVIASELRKNKHVFSKTNNFKKTFNYQPPKFINFKSDKLNEVLNIIKNEKFIILEDGKIKLPDAIKNLKIKINDTTFQLGIGGLHSKESKQILKPNDDELLIDKDVASYYPAIILNNKLFPEQIGALFLDIYEKIVNQRLSAKKDGNKVVSDSLKIVINGSFGKFGNKYSILYAPELLIQVTLTGQLALLMLIESLTLNNINVISANTDGIVSLLNKKYFDSYENLCEIWQKQTGFVLESTKYKCLYSRDVNNYFALSVADKIKTKGAFTNNQLSKNPSLSICYDAVIKYLLYNKPIMETLVECKDITKFLLVRTVNGGAIWKNEYLGKVVRWIYSKDGEEIFYKKLSKTNKHNKVPKSENAYPVMRLHDCFNKINYDKYFEESLLILKSLGVSYE